MSSSAVFSSKFHNITFKTIERINPKDGRILRIGNLEINETDLSPKVFAYENHIVYHLDKYVMDSPDGKFVYIPCIRNFLINCNTMDAIYFPSNPSSETTFIGNSFSANTLIVIYSDAIYIVNTNSFITTAVKLKKLKIAWAQFNKDNELIITYTDINHGTAQKGRFDFGIQDVIADEIEFN